MQREACSTPLDAPENLSQISIELKYRELTERWSGDRRLDWLKCALLLFPVSPGMRAATLDSAHD